MATTIDWVVGGIVVAIGLAIFYNALREPLDLLFGFIKRGFVSAKDKISGAGDSGYQVIKYG